MGRGRPYEKYHDDPVIDAELHKPHKSWDFTDFQVVIGETRLNDWIRLKYATLIIADEICPDTGRRHGQGRITFYRAYRFLALKKIVGNDVRLAPTKCCSDDNYCRKFGTTLIIDHDFTKRGARNVFKEQKAAIADGATIRECADMAGANFQSIRSAEIMMTYLEPERPHDIRELHFVEHDSKLPSDVYRVNEFKFWNGYDGHSSIYINQAIHKLSLPQLRMVTGPSPFRVGRGRQARHNHVYFSGLDVKERRLLDRDYAFEEVARANCRSFA